MSEGELARYAAISWRLKDLLNQQIDQFRSYVTALEKQQAAIESGKEEHILAYIEIEERMVTGIFSMQKVIDPLEDMYHAIVPPDDISTLKSALEDLKNQAITQSAHNKNLIATLMADISGEIESLRNDPLAIAARRFIHHNAGTASLIDIEG